MITIDKKSDTIAIEIKVKPAGIFFKFLLFILGAAPMLVMLSVLVLSEKIASPFGFFIGFLIFGLISFYLFRVLLWNSYGRELYTISKNEFMSVNDFRWFKDNPKTTPFSDFTIMFADLDRPLEIFSLTNEETIKTSPKKEYILVFMIDGVALPSVVKLNADHLKTAADKFSTL